MTIDGPAMTADVLLRRLDDMGIAHSTVDHPPLFTVEQSRALRGELPGAHVKNLFLCNKRGRMWLITCLEDRRIDLKSMRRELGTSSLSFCSPERLMRYLGVIPGAVSPFGVINDSGAEVEVVLDAALMEMHPLNFHPLDNSKTTAVSAPDLVRFLESTGHPPVFLDFNQI
jgi:Ala-tRNA(Pro) deacylase